MIVFSSYLRMELSGLDVMIMNLVIGLKLAVAYIKTLHIGCHYLNPLNNNK